ncbi:MAG: hypothetical protein H7831_10135 [Magnetococcus sp. WYHC-3]
MSHKELLDRILSITCPVCGGHPRRIFRCPHCGEVRCGQDTCVGSEGRVPGWAGSGTQCRNCGEGRYQVIDIAGEEMSRFLRTYQRPSLSDAPRRSR